MELVRLDAMLNPKSEVRFDTTIHTYLHTHNIYFIVNNILSIELIVITIFKIGLALPRKRGFFKCNTQRNAYVVTFTKERTKDNDEKRGGLQGQHNEHDDYRQRREQGER